eukprot:3507928-Rhodomonas_salina.1
MERVRVRAGEKDVPRKRFGRKRRTKVDRGVWEGCREGRGASSRRLLKVCSYGSTLLYPGTQAGSKYCSMSVLLAIQEYTYCATNATGTVPTARAARVTVQLELGSLSETVKLIVETVKLSGKKSAKSQVSK